MTSKVDLWSLNTFTVVIKDESVNLCRTQYTLGVIPVLFQYWSNAGSTLKQHLDNV